MMITIVARSSLPMKGRAVFLVSSGCLAAAVGAASLVVVVRRVRNRQKLEAARARWAEEAGEDVVVLHQVTHWGRSNADRAENISLPIPYRGCTLNNFFILLPIC